MLGDSDLGGGRRAARAIFRRSPTGRSSEEIGEVRIAIVTLHSSLPSWVTSVVLCKRRLRIDFRYTPLATKLARHCNMPRRIISRLMHCSK